MLDSSSVKWQEYLKFIEQKFCANHRVYLTRECTICYLVCVGIRQLWNKSPLHAALKTFKGCSACA